MWTISIHMEDKWQHILNTAKCKSKDARSELKALNKQAKKEQTSTVTAQPFGTVTFQHLGLSPRLICTFARLLPIAHWLLAGYSFNSGIWASERFTQMILNFCLFVDLCISSFSLPHAPGEHKPKELSCYSFPQGRMHLFYHEPKSAAPNLTIALLALLVNFYHFLSIRHKD